MLARVVGWDSDGVGTATVKITSRTVSNTTFDQTCHSGVRFASDGVLFLIQSNGGFSSVSGEWLLVGSAASFYLKRTITSGDLQTDTNGDALWHIMNATKTFEITQAVPDLEKSSTVFFEISSDASGSPVIATATMTFTAENSVS
ncbi:MAG: hypothetical protein ACKVKT_03245 [Rhodospirillales bacterium]